MSKQILNVGKSPNLDYDDSEDVEEEEVEEKSVYKRRLGNQSYNKRLTAPSKAKLRNLKQYASMTDDEFDELFAKKQLHIESDKAWEDRIKLKLDEFNKDYDLNDLKANDLQNLRALASAFIRLDDYESLIGQLLAKGLNESNIFLIERVSNIQKTLREGISKIQDDLKISRKTRKTDKEVDAVTFIDDLKKKAKHFYEERMMYIFCPKCGQLLATIWFQYPQFKSNVIHLKCHKTFKDNVVCDGEVNVTSEWLLNNGMRNKADIPESMR